MKTRIIGGIVLAAAICLPAAWLIAQTATNDDTYKTMLEDAMRPGKYAANQSDNWDMRARRVSGTVSVKTPEAEEWSGLEGEVPLEASDSIKTGADGAAEIYLDDKGAIAVGRGSEVEISIVDKTETTFTLKYGSLAARAPRFLNEKYKMQVRLPLAVCTVRGPEFAVQYILLGKETGAAAFEDGKLAVKPMDEKGQELGDYLLDKNTELTFTADQRRLKTAPLSRMRRHSPQITALRQSLKNLKKSWKPISENRRQALRSRVFKQVTGKDLGDGGEPRPKKPKKKVKPAVKTKGGKTPARKVKKAPAQRQLYDEPEAE